MASGGTQQLMINSRLAEGRRLRDENAKLRQENAALRDENAALLAHLDIAVGVLGTLNDKALPHLVLVDGWNLILSAEREFRTREALLAHYQAYVDAHPDTLVWVVFDGPRETVMNEGRLRVSYTGGKGAQRADRFITAVVRAARYLGVHDRVKVVTYDKKLRKETE